MRLQRRDALALSGRIVGESLDLRHVEILKSADEQVGVIVLRGYPADAPDVVGEEHYLEFCLGFLVACDVVERTVNCYLVAALHLGVNAEGFGELTAHGRIHAAGVDNEVGVFVALQLLELLFEAVA